MKRNTMNVCVHTEETLFCFIIMSSVSPYFDFIFYNYTIQENVLQLFGGGNNWIILCLDNYLDLIL